MITRSNRNSIKRRVLVDITYLGDCLDIGRHTSLGNGHIAVQLVQFLPVLGGQLEVPGVDPRLFVLPGNVSCQFENLAVRTSIMVALHLLNGEMATAQSASV